MFLGNLVGKTGCFMHHCTMANFCNFCNCNFAGRIFWLSDSIFYMVSDNGMVNGTNYTGRLLFPVIQKSRTALATWISALCQDLTIVSWVVTAIVVYYIVLYSSLLFARFEHTTDSPEMQSQNGMPNIPTQVRRNMASNSNTAAMTATVA
jgi:hypothetical protein